MEDVGLEDGVEEWDEIYGLPGLEVVNTKIRDAS